MVGTPGRHNSRCRRSSRHGRYPLPLARTGPQDLDQPSCNPSDRIAQLLRGRGGGEPELLPVGGVAPAAVRLKRLLSHCPCETLPCGYLPHARCAWPERWNGILVELFIVYRTSRSRKFTAFELREAASSTQKASRAHAGSPPASRRSSFRARVVGWPTDRAPALGQLPYERPAR